MKFITETLLTTVLLYVGVGLFITVVFVLGFVLNLPTPQSFEEVAALAKVVSVPCGIFGLLLSVFG